MYVDTIILTSLVTVGSVVIITGGILYYFYQEGKARLSED